MDGRIKHIDIAKGISITLVAIYHSKLSYYFPSIIGPMELFRMPLFFLLSGVFFSWQEKPKKFLIKKSEALLKPYFSVLLVVLFFNFISGDVDLKSQLKGIFYGNGATLDWEWQTLWFLTHLFAIYIFSYILFCYANIQKLRVAMLFLLLSFIATGSIFVDYFWHLKIDFPFMTTEIYGLPFSLDIALITSSYFIFGQLLKNRLVNFRPVIWFFFLSLSTFFLISQFTSAHVDLNKRVYDSPVYATLGALCGIYIIMSISYIISKSYWLSLIPLRLGQASIYILIFHLFIMNTLFHYFDCGCSGEIYLTLLAFLILGLGIFIPLIIKWLVEKSDILALAFLPFKSNKLIQRKFNFRH